MLKLSEIQGGSEKVQGSGPAEGTRAQGVQEEL